MTQKKSLETLYSSDRDSLLADVYWRDIKDQTDLWEKLFTVLAYLADNQRCLRAMSGNLSVSTSAVRKDIFQTTEEEWQCWSIVVSTEGIQQLKEAYNHACESISNVIPYKIPLRAEAAILLPAEVQEVQIEFYDFVVEGHCPILKLQAGNGVNVSQDLREWWTTVNTNKPEDASVMYLELFVEFSENARYICLSLDSNYDIFRPIHFDSTPNHRCAVLTFERHMRYLSQLAAQTGGTLEIYDDLVNFFP